MHYARTHPHQFGLSTRAGTEGVYKLLHTTTVLDPCATVLSVDAVGAYDHVSRQAMLEGLRYRPALAWLLPFARQFYSTARGMFFFDPLYLFPTPYPFIDPCTSVFRPPCRF